MVELDIAGLSLQLLPQRAIYLPSLSSLLVSDVHLGKAETFQSFGIPIPRSPTLTTLAQLEALCDRLSPAYVFILGDLFHSPIGLSDDVISDWQGFCDRTSAAIQLIAGNHDRALLKHLDQMGLAYGNEAVMLDSLVLSHEPVAEPCALNICGHLHPYLRLTSRLDTLRLPCFYWEKRLRRLTLPPFGEFTGGYEVRLTPDAAAYVIAEDAVISFDGVHSG